MSRELARLLSLLELAWPSPDFRLGEAEDRAREAFHAWKRAGSPTGDVPREDVVRFLRLVADGENVHAAARSVVKRSAGGT